MLKVIAFDVFNTVVKFDQVPYEEKKAYADHIREHDGIVNYWEPLTLPESWERLPAYADAPSGISMLRRKYTVVTCSNGPVGMMTRLSKFNDIDWDFIIPLELRRVFKPNLQAYMTMFDLLNVAPHEVMMVTANATFGDLEAAKQLGMVPKLIRSNGGKPDIVDLAQELLA